MKFLTLSLAFAAVAASSLAAADRPNILWLSFEDTSAYEVGCYGNPDVKTPNIDQLAREGLRFTRAWSNGVQCSPARSTLITGCYSPAFGTDIHRQERLVPAALFGFPRYLKQAGYYTTNNVKTDYNASNFETAAVWTHISKTASYNDPARRPDQPFFSVFNAGITHMSRLTTYTTKGRRDFAAEGLDPAKLRLPPHVPDLPDIRSDYAFHLEGVEDVDRWVGLFLDDLKAKGLADDTIIFVFSDHGGCLPRGKGFVFETGLQVPLVVYIPPRWRHLAGDLTLGRPCDRLVAFVDFAPTLLSLAGLPPPDYMMGQPFLGPFAAKVKPRAFNFGYTANREDNFSPARAVTDGDFLYIRNYAPRRPLALRNFFQWGMPGNLAWDTAYLHGDLRRPEHLAPFAATPFEQLFDLRQDPFNIHDLAADPAQAGRLASLSRQLDTILHDSGDLGLMPRDSRKRGDEDLYSWVRRTGYSIDELQAAALLGAHPAPGDAPALAAGLTDPRPEFRYWAASGLAELAARHVLKSAPAALARATHDEDESVAAVACEALVYLGEGQDAAPRLIELLLHRSDEAHASLETLSLIDKPALLQFVPALREIADRPNTRDKSPQSILINLGFGNPVDLYANALGKGVKANKQRRPLVPDPVKGQGGSGAGAD